MEHQNSKPNIIEKLEKAKENTKSDAIKKALEKKIESINKEYVKK